MTETPNPKDTRKLFRAQAVRHNTPGLFGEVILYLPPSSWVLTGMCVVAIGVIAMMLAGLRVDGVSLWTWLVAR